MSRTIFVSVILLSILVIARAGMDFDGDDTPAKDMKKYFKPETMAKVKAGMAEAGVEIPKALEKVASMVTAFNDEQEQKEKEEPKLRPDVPKKTPNKKIKINLRNAYKTIELAKLDPSKAVGKDFKKEKETIKDLSNKLGYDVKKFDLKTPKGVKAAKVEKEVVPTPVDNNPSKGITQCSDGDCCDLSTGMFKQKGIECISGPCEKPTKCLGTSAQCPPSFDHLQDGTPCPEGSCKSGICVVGKPTAVVKAKQEAKKQIAKEQEEKKKERFVLPTIPESAFPHGSFASQQRGRCTAGECCDEVVGKFKPAGAICSPPSDPCLQAAGLCNGFVSKCPLKAKADGSICPGGKCYEGQCVLEEPEKAVAPAAPAAAPATPAPAVVQADHSLDASNYRRAEIRRLAAQRHKLTNMLMLKNMLEFTKDKEEEEQELKAKAYFPYEVPATEREESADNTFSVHKYVKDVTEKAKHESQMAALNALQGNLMAPASALSVSSVTGISLTTGQWVGIIAGGAFVIILVAVIVLVSACGGKKKNPKKDDDGYDKI